MTMNDNRHRVWLYLATFGMFALMLVSIYRQAHRDKELADVAKVATDRYNSLNATLQDTRNKVTAYARNRRVN